MQTMPEVFQMLRSRHPQAGIRFVPAQNMIFLDRHAIRAAALSVGCSLHFTVDGQEFSQNVGSYDALFGFLDGILSGKIAVTRYDDCTIVLEGELPDLRSAPPMPLSGSSRVLSAILGAVLITFAFLLIWTAVTRNEVFSDGWKRDIIAALFSLIPLSWGIGLAHHAVSKRPMKVAQMSGFALGTLVCGTGLSLLYTTVIDDDHADLTVKLILTGMFSLLIAGGIVAIRASFRKPGSRQTPPRRVFVTRTVNTPAPAQAEALLTEMLEETKTTQIRLKQEPDTTPALTGSRLGGKPYWDAALPYPLDDSGEPMALLAQIALNELPETGELPHEGILQFFVRNDESWGVGAPCRVIWHQTVKPDQPEPQNAPETVYLGFAHEIAVSLSAESVSISPDDPMIDTIMHRTAQRMGIPLEPSLRFHELIAGNPDMNLLEILRQKSDGDHLLGYPVFLNGEQPESDGIQRRLLLQIDTPDAPYETQCGKAHFFITPEKLRQQDFSDVTYTWACY